MNPIRSRSSQCICTFLLLILMNGDLHAQGPSVATKINVPVASAGAAAAGIPSAPVAPVLLAKASRSLCGMIDCEKASPPVITEINTQPIDPNNPITVHPGEYLLVNGNNFIGNDLYPGLCNISLASPYRGQSTLSLYDPHSPDPAHPNRAQWSDKAVFGILDPTVSGYPDQIVTLTIVRADFATSQPVRVRFIASRTQLALPSADVHLVKCSDAADQNSCSGWSDYSPTFTPGLQMAASYYGSHVTFMGQNSGTDKYSINLKNGWVVYGVGQGQAGSCPADIMSVPAASLLGASQSTFDVSWVSACQLRYFPQIQILGPTGVPWK